MHEFSESVKPIESLFDQKIINEKDEAFKIKMVQELEEHIRRIQASKDPKFSQDNPDAKKLVAALRKSTSLIESAWEVHAGT